MSLALDSWKEEKRSAYLYRVLAKCETAATRRNLFDKLAREAEIQSALWAKEANRGGRSVPETYRPDLRVRTVAWLIRCFGGRHIKPVLAAIKIRGLSVYSSQRPGGHPMPTSLEEIGASHRGGGTTGGLRAAVFGVNDGLVSIACLVMGVAGAIREPGMVVLTGLSGLLAGALSMAAGEYISMRSQREMFEYQIGLERDELAQYPEEEAGELALIYMARGMDETEAHALAQRMIANPEVGLDTLAREELGLNPDELGSPWMAAFLSFFAFALGGSIPLLPYLVGTGQHALPLAVALTAFALFGVGATLSLFTGRGALWGGLRMLLIGSVAGGMTYWVGNLLGASVIP